MRSQHATVLQRHHHILTICGQWVTGITSGLLFTLAKSGAWPVPAVALPQNGVVRSGEATIQPNPFGNQLTIQQSTERAVIDWREFSVGVSERVDFQQPSVNAATLNRVTGDFSSDIAGQITANGQVLLVNPNGILITPDAQINVGSFLGTTLELANEDFLAGQLKLHQLPGEPLKTVENHGQITVREGGFAALAAPGVANHGIIRARMGTVALASGTAITLDFAGDQLVSVMVEPEMAGQILDAQGQPLSNLILQRGNILAEGGLVTITAQSGAQVVNNVINLDGIIRAQSLQDFNGKIVLKGGDQGQVTVAGELDASGIVNDQPGGSIQIDGEQVVIAAGAQLNVSGPTGSGGTIDIAADHRIQIDSEITQPEPGDIKALSFKDRNEDNQLTVDLNAPLVLAENRSALTGEATVVNVNVAEPDILQAGVDVAATGATVNIAPGHFTGTGEQLLAINKNLTVKGTSDSQVGEVPQTVLDGEHRQQVVEVSGGNVILENLVLQNGFAESGGGLLVGSESQVRLQNSTITGNEAFNNGGGIYLSEQGALTIQESIISSNFAYVSGGGIYSRLVETKISNSNIAKNHAANEGGGIFNIALPFDGEPPEPGSILASPDRGELNVINSQITSNYATDGAGIFNIGTISIEDQSMLRGNKARVGGGLFNSLESVAVVRSSTVSGNFAEFEGGGLFNIGALRVTGNSEIVNNTSGQGGGVASRGGTVEVFSSTIGRNKANFGGGIFNNSGSVTITNSNIEDNSVASIGEIDIIGDKIYDAGISFNNGGGGAIFNENGAVILSLSLVKSNQAIFGGGLLNSGTGTLTVGNNSTVSGNTASSDGGGILNSDDGVLTVDNSIISGNTANTNGGGLFNNENGVLTVRKSTVSDNTAKDTGGGFSNNNDGILIVNNSTVSGNTASNNGGGLVNNNRGMLTINNSIVSGNSSSGLVANGGGLSNNDIGTLTINNSQVLYNSASGSGGGLSNSGALTVDSSTVSGNTAGNNGGGLYSSNTITINNSTVSDNKASNLGGGLFNSGKLTINSSTISGNTAGNNGGGISNGSIPTDDATLIIDNSNISENTTNENGGGIFNSGILTVNISTISRNTASNGGGFFNINMAIFNRNIISRNIAIESGGGIFNSGNLIVADNTINKNVAKNENGLTSFFANFFPLQDLASTDSNSEPNVGGGGIFNVDATFLNDLPISDDDLFVLSTENIVSRFNTQNDSNNISGRLFINGFFIEIISGQLFVDNSRISGNISHENGGGISNLFGVVEIVNSNIEGNTALNDGGGISNNLGSLTLTNSVITDNNANNDGGGLFDSGLSMITETAIFGNTAANQDDNIANASEQLGFVSVPPGAGVDPDIPTTSSSSLSPPDSLTITSRNLITEVNIELSNNEASQIKDDLSVDSSDQQNLNIISQTDAELLVLEIALRIQALALSGVLRIPALFPLNFSKTRPLLIP